MFATYLPKLDCAMQLFESMFTTMLLVVVNFLFMEVVEVTAISFILKNIMKKLVLIVKLQGTQSDILV